MRAGRLMARRRPAKKKTRPTQSLETRRRRAESLKRRTDEQRFWAKVQAPPEGDDESCWLWTGAVNQDGYGIFRIGSAVDGTRRSVRAHRYAYELAKKITLPADVVLLHTCDVRRCVYHLSPGSQIENIRDMIEKGRNVPPPVRRRQEVA